MLTFVQSQAAQSLQQGRAATCSTLLESSVAGSAVLVWAGVDGSFCPACFVPWELPAHGGSTLQTDTGGVCRSLGHLGLPPCSRNHKDGLRCNVERPLTGEELLRSTGISIQLPQGSGTRLEHAAAVPASGKHTDNNCPVTILASHSKSVGSKSETITPDPSTPVILKVFPVQLSPSIL